MWNLNCSLHHRAMKKVIGHIISLTTIFLLVIFFTVPTVDAAIAANDSSVAEVNVYSTDKIKKIKPLKEFPYENNTPYESNPPYFTISKCPSRNKKQFGSCNFRATNITQAWNNYKRAVDDCNSGGGTIKLINNAYKKMNRLQSLCQPNLKINIQDFIDSGLEVEPQSR